MPPNGRCRGGRPASPGIPTAPTAGKRPDFRWWREDRRRVPPNRTNSLERLLDRAGERKQALLDENGHLAGIADRLAPLLENARIPLDAVGELVGLALVAIGGILQVPQLEGLGADILGEC